MKNYLLLIAVLLFHVMGYSQTFNPLRFCFSNSIETKPISTTFFNDSRHISIPFNLSKKNVRALKKELRKNKKHRTFYKLLPFIFKKRLSKSPARYIVYTKKDRKKPKGFHEVDGLFDPTYVTFKMKARRDAFDNYASMLKVIYGYQFAIKNSTYVTTYPGLAISPIRQPEKQSVIGNLTKDFILGMKVNINLIY